MTCYSFTANGIEVETMGATGIIAILEKASNSAQTMLTSVNALLKKAQACKKELDKLTKEYAATGNKPNSSKFEKLRDELGKMYNDYKEVQKDFMLAENDLKNHQNEVDFSDKEQQLLVLLYNSATNTILKNHNKVINLMSKMGNFKK